MTKIKNCLILGQTITWKRLSPHTGLQNIAMATENRSSSSFYASSTLSSRLRNKKEKMGRVKTPAMLSWALNTPGFIGSSFACLLSPYMMMNTETRKMKCNFQRHSHVTPRFGSAETSCSERALRETQQKQTKIFAPAKS